MRHADNGGRRPCRVPSLGRLGRASVMALARIQASPGLRHGGLLALLVIAVVAWPGASQAACAPSALPIDSPLGLVLSGGGSKGAYEAGVAAALVAQGVSIRLAAGSSAGALNAAMLVDGRMGQLEARWRTITREQVYALRTPILFAGLLPGWITLWALDAAGSLFDPQPLRELISSSIDLDRIRASPMRLLIVTTDPARR